MADVLDPATMDALNQLGSEIEAETGAGTTQEPADPAPQAEPPSGDDAALEPLEGQETASEGEGEADGEGEEQAAKPKPKRSGVEKDVQRLLRERYEARNKQAEAEARAAAAEARAAEAEARIAAQTRADPAAPPTGQTQQPPVIQRQGETGQDFETRVQAEAQRRAEAATFNAACDRVAMKGAETHKDFADAQGALLGAFGRQVNARPEFLQAIIRLENGHDVFHYLGTNLEDAEKIFAHGNPVDLVMSLGDLSTKLKTPKTPRLSSAPAPVTPIRGGGSTRSTVRLDDDKTPMDDWSKQFLKDMAS